MTRELRERQCLFSGLIKVLIAADASIARVPKEGDRNRNYKQNGDQDQDMCHEGM